MEREQLLGKTNLLFAPTYYPLKLSTYKSALYDNHFEFIRCFDLDSIWIHPSQQKPKTGSFDEDFHQIDWYGILARKK